MEEDLSVYEDFYREAFPSVSPYTRSRFTNHLSKTGLDFKWFYAPNLEEHVSQGDIIRPTNAFFYDFEEGRVRTTKEPCMGMLIQHTCDMSVDDGRPRNDYYNVAPVFPTHQLPDLLKESPDLERNLISHLIYIGRIPSLGTTDDWDTTYFADLSMMGSVKSAGLHGALEADTLERLCSLSQSGYFFLLSKLTVHLLRGDERYS